MARSDIQVNFRMPIVLKERLEDAARTSNRTLTAEIVSRLEASLSAPASVPALPLDAQGFVSLLGAQLAEQVIEQVRARLGPLMATDEELALRPRREAIRALQVQDERKGGG